MEVTVVIEKEYKWYIAKCLETGVASQGKTLLEAMKNVKETLELYYEDIIDIIDVKMNFNESELIPHEEVRKKYLKE